MRFFAPMSDIAATARVSRPLWGVFWMLVTGASFVAVTALVKLVGDGIPPAQSAFLRYAMGLVLVLPMFLPVFKARLSRRALTLFGLRGAFHTFGVILWFYAMTQIPVAEVTAMNFLNPIYVTLLAAVLLGERLAIRRILAILVAFAGALVILRPGLREVGPGHIAMLFTAASFAGGYLIAKIMADEGRADMGAAWLAVPGRGLRDTGPLHDDAGLCRRPPCGDAAGDLRATDLGDAGGGDPVR